MKRKIVLLLLLFLVATGFIFAEGATVQAGIGYHGSFLTNSVDMPSTDIDAYPLGASGYLGMGYRFGEKKMLSAGLEFKTSFTFKLEAAYTLDNFVYQARGFFKFKPDDIFSVVALGGYQDTFKEISLDFDTINWTVGGRFVFLFIYAEYMVVFSDGFSGNIESNEFSLGYTILK